jgi:hypothetical protein
VSAHPTVVLVLIFVLIAAIGLIAGLISGLLARADGASSASAVRAGGRAFIAVYMLGLAVLATALRL